MADDHSAADYRISFRTVELAKECARRHRSCLYTAASLYSWLRIARSLKIGFVVLPIIFAGIATWKIFSPNGRLLPIILTGGAGLIPAVYEALKMDDHIGNVRKLAGEFTNLRDRFRQAALVTSKKPYPEFEAECTALMDRMDKAREEGITAPLFVFKWAKRQIARGDYRDVLEEHRLKRP